LVNIHFIMTTTFDIVYYVLLFFAIYFQVFFLVIFFEKKKHLKEVLPVTLNKYLTVTFLIPCWNEASTILSTIESVLSVDYPKDKLQIFVIDDGSTDATWSKVQKFSNHKQITLLKKENGGKHTALNYALESVTTDLVVSFDADTKINKYSLLYAVQYFLKDPELMALGGAVLIESPRTIAQRAQCVEYQMFSYTKRMLGFVGGVLVVPGAFSVFRREIFDKVGGYTKGHSLEDLELTFRIHDNGYKVDHCHTAIVTTKGPASIRALFKQRLRWGYGFLSNVTDYKSSILNKKFGNFGMFTLPMSVFSYVMIVFVFFLSLYRIGMFVGDQILRVNLVGWHGFSYNFDSFFISTSAVNLIGLTMYILIFTSIFMGKSISKVERVSFRSLFAFLLLYSVLAPLWILRTLYNWVFKKGVAWR
jgi:cellulose synthase/poly-beta-1,6-N-acetylglucosamine synthase-like glycosyltransferase